MLGYMIQAHVDTLRGFQRDNARSGAPNNVLPGCSQLHPRGSPRQTNLCASKGESRVGFACWEQWRVHVSALRVCLLSMYLAYSVYVLRMGLCRARSWTQRCLWVPADSAYPVLLWYMCSVCLCLCQSSCWLNLVKPAAMAASSWPRYIFSLAISIFSSNNIHLVIE